MLVLMVDAESSKSIELANSVGIRGVLILKTSLVYSITIQL